ncbi:MAG: GNAT family N-acetyltransferase [Candidatus Bathyarchaeia archaeon]
MVKILEETDDLTSFDCSTNDTMELNLFIHSEAIPYQKEKLGITYLFLYNDLIVGFVTLAMSKIEAKWMPSVFRAKTEIKDYPALLVGQLATRNDYRKRKIGKTMCLWCLENAKQLSEKIGCRLVIVFTKGKLNEFYEKCGFQIIPKYQTKEKKWMFIQVP